MTKRVQAELAAAGIELKPPVEFSVGADGLEAAPHPMSDRIKAVMSQHNALFDEYQNALIMKAEALSLQRADEATQAYYAAYENKKFDLAHQIIRNLAAAGPMGLAAAALPFAAGPAARSLMFRQGMQKGLANQVAPTMGRMTQIGGLLSEPELQMFLARSAPATASLLDQ